MMWSYIYKMLIIITIEHYLGTSLNSVIAQLGLIAG